MRFFLFLHFNLHNRRAIATHRAMASPMVESRIEPHKKAHFSLQIGDRIRDGDDTSGDLSSVKCESSKRYNSVI